MVQFLIIAAFLALLLVPAVVGHRAYMGGEAKPEKKPHHK
jgi:hypothetical protein